MQAITEFFNIIITIFKNQWIFLFFLSFFTYALYTDSLLDVVCILSTFFILALKNNLIEISIKVNNFLLNFSIDSTEISIYLLIFYITYYICNKKRLKLMNKREELEK